MNLFVGVCALGEPGLRGAGTEECASFRKLAANRVHGMMVCVLKARMAEEASLNGLNGDHDDTDDRGSDAGESMCMACSYTELLHDSSNEAAYACACHGVLHDECDSGPGTLAAGQ